MDQIMEYIIEDALILIPVLLVLGKFLKNTPGIADWLIPYILLAFGIVLALLLIDLTVEGVIQGILVTGATVFVHQIFKQSGLQKKDKNGTIKSNTN